MAAVLTHGKCNLLRTQRRSKARGVTVIHGTSGKHRNAVLLLHGTGPVTAPQP